MKRAAVILTSNDLNPFYGIVIFDSDPQLASPWDRKLDEAVREHFRENWEAPEGDSPDDWFGTVLGDYTYFYIPMEIAIKLQEVSIPIADVEDLNNSDDAAQVLLEQLMISVCEQFANSPTLPRQE